jgi:hypothetical protein
VDVESPESNGPGGSTAPPLSCFGVRGEPSAISRHRGPPDPPAASRRDALICCPDPRLTHPTRLRMQRSVTADHLRHPPRFLDGAIRLSPRRPPRVLMKAGEVHPAVARIRTAPGATLCRGDRSPSHPLNGALSCYSERQPPLSINSATVGLLLPWSVWAASRAPSRRTSGPMSSTLGAA